MTPNVKAFLDMLAVSEIGEGLLAVSDNGYNVIVGSTAERPTLFDSYRDHPRRSVELVIQGRRLRSTAAGRYQLLARYFDAYRRLLKLPDFSPTSQDAIAIRQLQEQGAMSDIEAGRFSRAVGKARKIWASLPGSGYGQHENAMSVLQEAYVRAGGVIGTA